ncbi:MAG: alpha-L-fucosidase [Prevotellaceae bacterium]|jgi:alpha-L-fucosidase|nr:alpha-L-fucosidase [Prevotellaceae bacterium]
MKKDKNKLYGMKKIILTEISQNCFSGIQCQFYQFPTLHLQRVNACLVILSVVKKQVFRSLLIYMVLFGWAGINNGHTQNDDIPVAPDKYRKPRGYDPLKNSYEHSLPELKKKFSETMIRRAATEYNRLTEINNNGKWKPTAESIDAHKTPEWFEDCKFGMFIDWGLWSVAGWAPQKDKAVCYPNLYELEIYENLDFIKYHAKNWSKDFERDDFIPFFTAKNFNPERLVDLAAESGVKYIIPACKQFSGFCLWSSSYTFRDAEDMQRKNIIEPLAKRCKSKELKFGFYFSLDEWEYPVINGAGALEYRRWGGTMYPYTPEIEKKASGKVAVKNFAKEYIIPQAIEFIDAYNPDILWYDGEWDTPAEQSGSYEIAAYFYNKTEGEKEVAVNDRYGTINGKWLRAVRGDIFTGEYDSIQKELKNNRVREEKRGMSRSFGFNWQDSEKNIDTSKELINTFVDIVSQGGNLLLVVNLDGQGALPEIQEKRLKEIGKWLKINGAGIYSTRTYTVASEGDIRYTRSKDNKTVYAISLGWPGKQLTLKSVKPADGSDIYLLGEKEPLEWNYDNGATTITLPDKLQKESNRPCRDAYTFSIQKTINN